MRTEHRKWSIYGRVSTGPQKDNESIEQQLEQTRGWAEENGHEIVGEFTDEAHSDTTQ